MEAGEDRGRGCGVVVIALHQPATDAHSHRCSPGRPASLMEGMDCRPAEGRQQCIGSALVTREITRCEAKGGIKILILVSCHDNAFMGQVMEVLRRCIYCVHVKGGEVKANTADAKETH
ncbi:hypothetical protein E2C01_085861 [Portunus trituberculatus]|uniref:Uncharacterized protein n=1 Tax=Portunus trituberculatus TaxID=210409 RepID=A0A5B7JD24_PORTR|nr:hypothetical protein [Portunus trituberculatus]